MTDTPIARLRERQVENFVAKIRFSDECWLWTAARTPRGYPVFGAKRAHRVAYEMFVGPIPKGMTLDHLCHTRSTTCPGGRACWHRACVNPDHLEPVSAVENVMRGLSFAPANASRTHCVAGHEFSPANTRLRPYKGGVKRVCVECRNRRQRAYMMEKRSNKWTAQLTA